MQSSPSLRVCLIVLIVVSFVAAASAAPVVVSSCGNITPRVAEFRSLLGAPSNVATPPNSSGRREVNWDGVAAAATNTNTFPGNFFNSTSPRGLALTTPGTGFRVSDNNFADVNASYATQIAAFSTAKTFAPIGSNVLDVSFFVPGTATEATVSAFGAVFSDVDVTNSTVLEFFSSTASLGTFIAPTRCDATGHSFLGVIFDEGERVSRVRIISGQVSVSASANDITNGGASDIVVMDDFLYSEPIPTGTAANRILSATLLGTNEIPGPGDPDGTGSAVVTLDPSSGTVRFAISVANISAPTMAHIHVGGPTVAGSVVINFNPTFTNNLAVGTVTAAETLINQILANPGGFYVNVHNADFPAGAVRGQLQANATASTKFTFPVFARAPGAAGTLYKTDARIVNPSGASVDVLVQFYAGGGSANAGPSGTVTLTLAPGEQRVLDDFVKTQFNADAAIGALQLFASRPIVAVLRIYNDQRAVNQGTFSQLAQGQDDEVAARMSGVLPALSNSPIGSGPYRSNIGWFNGGSSTANLTLRAFDSNSTLLATVAVTVPPFSQLQQGVAVIFSTLGGRENFYVTYTTDVSTLYVYASVVDNVNGDAILIPAQ